MDNKVQASFIPKKPISGSGLSRNHSFSFVSLLTVLLFVIAAALTGGVFAYHSYMEAHIASLERALANAKAEFDPQLVAQYERLDRRLKSAKTIVDNHVAISPFFELLEKVTLSRVQFKDFQYGVEGQRPKVSMSGEASSFAVVALQAEEFNLYPTLIQEPLFSELNVNEVGNITFTFTAFLDESLVSYRRHVVTEPVVTNIEPEPIFDEMIFEDIDNSAGTNTVPTNGTTTGI